MLRATPTGGLPTEEILQAALPAEESRPSATEFRFNAGTIVAKVACSLPLGPRPECRDQGWGAAQQDERGPEREGADRLGWHHWDASGRALEGSGAVVADGDGVGLLVALADEGGEVLEVAG